MILRVCDVETSGMDPADGAEVCELGWVDLLPLLGQSGWAVNHFTHNSLYGVTTMPPEVRAVHHITMADLYGYEPFGPGYVADMCADVDVLVAHNCDFERRFIDAGGTPWICTYKSALRVWPEAPGHSNSVLRYWLEDQGLLSLDHDRAMPPHRAGPDAYVTAHILLALLKVATVEEMVEWTKSPRVLPKMPMGKWKGYSWGRIDWGYLDWILNKSDMDSDIKWNAERELTRRVGK